MICVLGWELKTAQEALMALGADVATLEVSSRKGVAGNEARVIRQRVLGDNKVELTYSTFKTDCDYVGG